MLLMPKPSAISVNDLSGDACTRRTASALNSEVNLRRGALGVLGVLLVCPSSMLWTFVMRVVPPSASVGALVWCRS